MGWARKSLSSMQGEIVLLLQKYFPDKKTATDKGN
jgi:hypothetical protein